MSYLENFLKSTSREEAMSTVIDIVEPKMYKIRLPQGKFTQDNLPDLFQTKWSKLLADIDQNQFILESFINAIFKDKYDINHLELSHLSISQVTKSKVNMIFGSFPDKSQHNKFFKLVKGVLGNDFIVENINGDYTTNRKTESEVMNVIAKAKREGKRVVLISKDMASRSFSIPEIDTVFLMYDQGLLSQTSQKVSRSFTSGITYEGDKKEIGTVISLSFDSNRKLIDPIDQYIINEASRINEGDEPIQDSIKRVAKSFNIFTNDINGQPIKLDMDKYATDLITSSDMVRVAMASINIEGLDSFQYSDIILDNRSVSHNIPNPDKEEINIKNVQTFIDTNEYEQHESDGDKMDKSELKQLYENIIYLVNNINVFYILDDGENNNISDIINSLETKNMTDEVEEYFGLKYKFIKYAIDNKILPVKLLNTIIKMNNTSDIDFNWELN
jgi:hypothetical protein